MNAVVPFQLGKRLDDLTLLSKSSLLAHFGMRDLGTLLDTLDRVAFPPGTTLFGQSEEGEHMYFVLEGEVRLYRGSMPFSRLGPGDHFGELAIFGVKLRPYTAHAETNVRLARLSRSRFLSLATNHPRVALHLAEALGASLATNLTAMTDDVGLLLRQRTLPRRSNVRVMIGGAVIDAPMGAFVGTLLPTSVDGALVVAATVDRRPVSLETPITSDARIEPLTLASLEGRRVHSTSLGLLLLEAARRALPNVDVRLGTRRGEARSVVLRSDAGPELVSRLEMEMRALVAAALPFREELWAVDEARVRFVEQGWSDAAALLPFHRDKTVSLVKCGGTFALGVGPVVPNARMLGGFSLATAGGEVWLESGEVIRRHASTEPSVGAVPTPVTAGVPLSERHIMERELQNWLETLEITSVGAFNRSCVTGRVDELIRVSEGFHEKHIGRIADGITARRPKIVAIAGPSSSGKTTFIKRLKVQLEVNGVLPVELSLDDYYVDRERTVKDESGDYDFESPLAIDLPLFERHAARLLAGERVRTARYDFLAGKSLPEGGPELALDSHHVLLVEGIHALNPMFTASLAPREAVHRVFVHPATALPFDRLSSVLSEDVRLVRRIVRDRHQRGYSASESIRRWPSVRRGEERHVHPFLELADVVFDTALVYELAVLRNYAERYLLEVTEDDPAYVTAYRLRQLIDRFVPIHADHVPPTSILREFIGGSGFDA